jgi:DNA-binding response OmpR family regulator
MASHRTVLLAESDPAHLDALGFSLRRRGYHVLVARDAGRADESLARSAPDAVVVEMLLPGGGGFRVAERARELGAAAVVMTGPSAGAHAAYALAVGADRFLIRPVAPFVVANAVEELCPLPPALRLRGSAAIPWRAARSA